MDEREPIGAEARPEEPASPAGPQVTTAEPLQPVSRPPLKRLALYLIACLGAACAGLIPTAVIVVLWLALRGDQQSPDILAREPGILVISALLGIYPMQVLMTTLFVHFVQRGSLADVGLVRHRWAADAGVGMVIGAGFIAVTSLVYLAFGWIRLQALPPTAATWLVLPLMCLLIGFTEELIFRGYILQTLEEWRGPRLAIATTSVLFWLVHLGGGNVHEPLGAAGMLAVGLTLALCRYATRSLWLPIGLHAAYDWGALGFGGGEEFGLPAFYRVQVMVPSWLVGPPGDVGLIDLLCLLILLAGVYHFLYRPRRGSLDGPAATADILGQSM